MTAIQWIGIALGVVLQIMLISALLKGHWRKYPFLLILIALEFLTTTVGFAATIDMGGKLTAEARRYYWLGETLQYVMVFACQTHLLYQAMAQGGNRKRLLYVILGGIIYAALSTWLAYDPRFGRWMNQLVRNFSFGSMLLNMMLWTTLARKPDRAALLITSGFGIQLAGGAIGHSLIQLAPSLVTAGNLVLLVCYLLFLLTIWRGVSAPVQVDCRGGGDLGAEPQHEHA